MPRPAWKSTGPPALVARARRPRSTAGCGSAEVVRARVELDARRARVERAPRLGDGVLVRRARRARARSSRPPDARHVPMHPVVGGAVAAGLVHREEHRPLLAGAVEPGEDLARGRPRSRRGRCGRCACARRTTSAPAGSAARGGVEERPDDLVVRRVGSLRLACRHAARHASDAPLRRRGERRTGSSASRLDLGAQLRQAEADAALRGAERHAGAPRDLVGGQLRRSTRARRASRWASGSRASASRTTRAVLVALGERPTAGRRRGRPRRRRRRARAGRGRGRRPGPRARGRARGCGP